MNYTLIDENEIHPDQELLDEPVEFGATYDEAYGNNLDFEGC